MGNGDRRHSRKMLQRKSQARLKARIHKAATARAERAAAVGKAEKKPTRAARKPAAAG